jgi:Mg2+/Co2+ transporter CorB
MADHSLWFWGLIFLGLLCCSALFSASETGLVALNRYRLRHQAEAGEPGARRLAGLLERPDRVIGLILLFNTFVNACASSVATLIGLKLLGEELGLAMAASVTTLLLLIFGEVTPKTLAALRPETVAYPASRLLSPLLRLCYPLVWLLNCTAHLVLRLLGVNTSDSDGLTLSREELRSVVQDAGRVISRRHQQMLVGILDLEQATVDDILVPRSEIEGIDLEARQSEIMERIINPRHTRLPVYRGKLDELVGILHVRRLPRVLIEQETLTAEALLEVVSEPYFVPAGTPLHTQLFNFQRERERIGLVVDEYGDLQGLITLEDLLAEIVGEFTTAPDMYARDVHPQEDGSFLVDGAASLRDLNRQMQWRLPTGESRTLNGLILHVLENIPEPGTTLRIGELTIEIVQTSGQAVRTARIRRITDPDRPVNEG